MQTIEMNENEKIRHSYYPSNCKVLLIGESAPASGNFFYKGDTLTTYTRDAFARAFPEATIPYSDDEFLNFFRNHGFFLDDLCLSPVNDEDAPIRQLSNQEGIPLLAKRIKAYQPIEVVCIMKGIRPYVKEAFDRANLPTSSNFHTIPLAVRGNQERYREELATILRELQRKHIINIA